MANILTPKQYDLIKQLHDGELGRLTLLSGSVRSGKTLVSLVAFALWVATMPEDATFLMCAKTLTSLRRNCLDVLVELAGSECFSFSLPRKEARLFGRRVYLEGANDAKSESKIRGLTLSGAYCDELSQFPEDFFRMLLPRMTKPGAKLIATTNPENPRHWLKAHYIDNAEQIGLQVLPFLLDDNTTLDADTVAAIKREYSISPAHYDRFILGKWVPAEGLVYPAQAAGEGIVPTVERRYTRYVVSIDYGTLNPFSAGLWGYGRELDEQGDPIGKPRWYRIREYYYDGRKARAQRTDGKYYTELAKLIGGLPVECIVVDPSAASFIAEIQCHGRYPVRKAQNDVVNGILFTADAFVKGKIAVNDCCTNCIEEFSAYRWDDKAAEDKPIKDNDHAMDDMRYFAYTILRHDAAPAVVQLRG
ncbi:MAG: PBSX family phage terminase large subunit [Oscillospiraceae bacterium]|jgi:PBSX family phage terminase large subunit|nr:PBSX family phage terminase large subunit [Oscillospiraceae bacterium]